MNGTPHNGWRSWAQLDLAQFSTWPSAPRRFLLVLLTALILIVVSVGWLRPMWRTLLVAQAQTQSLQQQYSQAALSSAQHSQDASGIIAQGVTPIAASDTAQWLAQLIEVAQSHHLRHISLTPIEPNTADKSTPLNASASLTEQLGREPMAGQITLTAEGRYPDILEWVNHLSERSEIISLENMTLIGVNDDTVKVQLQLFFIKAATP